MIYHDEVTVKSITYTNLLTGECSKSIVRRMNNHLFLRRYFN
jgi:hypothetical protein